LRREGSLVIDAVHAFADERGPARRLADALAAKLQIIDLHVFPDAESLPRVAPCAATAVLYRSLDRPDRKIMPLLLAADAMRRNGARRVILVAPYLCYMRQDMVFRPGEPLSRDVLGRLLGERFDGIVTVEPHLHRTRHIETAFAGATVLTASATPPLAKALSPADPRMIVVGPDEESGPWAAALARALSAGHVVLAKRRSGDRSVEIEMAGRDAIAGRPVTLVDDICSSGATLEAAVKALAALHAHPIDIAVVHALYGAATRRRLKEAGARRIVSTDSCRQPFRQVPLAPVLAEALGDPRLWM
jgi:ribose-phosphate pyrophosphokinase